MVTPGVAISSGASRPGGRAGAAGRAARDLEIGRVIAALAEDERVLTGARGREKVDALGAPHHPALRLHGVHLEPAPLEDPVIRAALELEAAVEPFVVDVERVGVLHDEFAHAQQTTARSRLVAVLRLEVVEHLRQLLVRLQLADVERDRLLVRHRQDELAPVAVAGA